MKPSLLVFLTLAPACAASTPPPPAPAPVVAAAPAALPGAEGLAAAAEDARKFENLGTHAWKITTASAEAQAWFDQGVRLYWAFNHEESFRAFAKSTQVDPSCAMCFWGAALAIGPNYNMPMMGRAEVAWYALARAKTLAAQAPELEQATITALAARYSGPELPDMNAQVPLNQAYAEAMKVVAQKFPDETEIQTLYAAAMMDTNPWKLWTLDGQPAAGTPEIVAALEGVLAKHPEHPGANHLYIHAVEASKQPERAIPSAERVAHMMPGAGHLVHMPAHVYQRVGRFADAADANRQGAAADLLYVEQAKKNIHYTSMYLSHNYLFLMFSTSMEGKSAESINAAKEGVRWTADETIAMMPWMEFYKALHFMAMARFGKWDEILSAAPPPAEQKATTGLYLFAHGLALLGKGQVDDAAKDQAALATLIAEVPADHPSGFALTRDLLTVGLKTLEGRIAAKRNKLDEAIKSLEEAVKREDALAYDEPPDWILPTRHHLGLVLLQAKKAKEAEAVYRADLQVHINNGWSLYGLAQALKAQKKNKDAAEIEKSLKTAWSTADMKLTASAF